MARKEGERKEGRMGRMGKGMKRRAEGRKEGKKEGRKGQVGMKEKVGLNGGGRREGAREGVEGTREIQNYQAVRIFQYKSFIQQGCSGTRHSVGGSVSTKKSVSKDVRRVKTVRFVLVDPDIVAELQDVNVPSFHGGFHIVPEEGKK